MSSALVNGFLNRVSQVRFLPRAPSDVPAIEAGAGGRSPRDITRDALTSAVAREARNELVAATLLDKQPREDLDVIAALLELPEPERRCRQCGKRR